MMLILLVIFVLDSEPKLPDGITCEFVRAKVTELGYIAAMAQAKYYGATWDQIREARKCLARPKDTTTTTGKDS